MRQKVMAQQVALRRRQDLDRTRNGREAKKPSPSHNMTANENGL